MDRSIAEAAELLLPDREFEAAFHHIVNKMAEIINEAKLPVFSARLLALSQKQPSGEYDVLAKEFGQLTSTWQEQLSQAGTELAEQEFPLIMAFFFFEGVRKVNTEQKKIEEQDIIVCLGQALDGRSMRSYMPIERQKEDITVSFKTEPAKTNRDYSMDIFFKAYVTALPEKGDANENTPPA